jgi:hypothetical protein
LKKQSVRKPSYAFTRFSITGFGKVISNLSMRQREIIDSFGFGSLLLFDKCNVPNKFVKWIAKLVDYKYGNIVINGKIISLSKESINSLLGIPLGGRPFPIDTKNGRSLVLKKFNKESIPSVNFLTRKLQNKDEQLCDEDTFIYFILIALSSFLRPNSCLVPSSKFFGIFDDLANCKELDWSGFVLNWLLHHIKKFNKGKNKAGKEPGTLGGCMYYLAVSLFYFSTI